MEYLILIAIGCTLILNNKESFNFLGLISYLLILIAWELHKLVKDDD